MVATAALDDLKGQRPEWRPWLTVVEEVLREASSDAWDAAVPPLARPDDRRAPLLAGATMAIEGRLARRSLERLLRAASASGTEPMGTLAAVRPSDADVRALLRASACHDGDTIRQFASASGVDAEALLAVIALAAVPLLQACNRQWAAQVFPGWTESYCPVCGSWPAFTEVRGIERSRHHRCGRCGGEWHARALCCVYCGMSDHHQLVTLVPEQGDAQGVIDACRACLGYVKTFTRLQGCAPGSVMVEDLASVALDVAAIAEDYQRPAGAGYPLNLTVTPQPGARGLFGWRV